MYQLHQHLNEPRGEGNNSAKRVLIVTAVEAEREAVLAGLAGDYRFDVVAAGVGTAAAAAGTAIALAVGAAHTPADDKAHSPERDTTRAAADGTAYSPESETISASEGGTAYSPDRHGYAYVISAGIGGGFAGAAEIGSLVVASRMVAADLGSDSPDGFISVDELGFGSSVIPAEDEVSAALTGALRSAGLDARLGPVLTVATTTGTLAGAQALAARVPGAAAEGMEGFGVAEAARQFGLPALELRAISNAVGPRDRGAWKIGEALSALRQASSILPEVFFT
ncbi:futalosine hydrolase [Saccharibacillus kuerlensis]|uniref:Futalosine hydrolase n=1 Tax=Saccharibacillus kuerlensis TaxID=459527 RepID=A0ABQ2L1Z3_9BACL|nr:futalosine hydrolase [Saccharibacillus kuerlensis]GGN98175.1 hypothetical protein GCM10010969_16910 [Saccharibacillus kuerlensis]